MPGDLYGGSAAFSHNARFVASRTQWGSGGAFRHELLIWDLTPLRTKLPPAPGN